MVRCYRASELVGWKAEGIRMEKSGIGDGNYPVGVTLISGTGVLLGDSTCIRLQAYEMG